MKMILLAFHHSGYFKLGKRTTCENDITNYFKKVDPDLMSFFELQDMIKKLGLRKDSSIYYCKPRFGLKDGLVKVATDENVLEMFKEYVNCTCIVNYVEYHNKWAK